MSHFEIVSKYKDKNIHLPERKTVRSAGYDFEVAEDIVIPSYIKSMRTLGSSYGKEALTLEEMSGVTKMTGIKPILVPTGVKAYLDPGAYLELSVRSSTPLKQWLILANGVGIIDADYVNNVQNEGEIFFQVINLSPYDLLLKKGDRIGQGVIHKYEVVEGDMAVGVRSGGFGSTNE